MSKIKSILNRCNEIIKDGEAVINSKDEYSIRIKTVINLNSSIENIYNLCYPNGVPEHLRLSNLQDTLINLGFNPIHLNVFGYFSHRFEAFKGFKEDLEKGLITTNLIKIISLDIYSDMIEQAKSLRTHNTESLNRASCVLARIVLEETLKKICSDNSIKLKTDKASEANIELKKNYIYSNAEFKLVDAWLTIGNSAAHPKSKKLDFKSITENQLDDLIKNVEDFARKYI